MNMRRSRKAAIHRDVVIVCEGSTTEYNYFCEVRKYINDNIENPVYTNIRIIPGDSDSVSANSNRPSRVMVPDASKWRYYEMAEESIEEYRKYRAQPVRYVREAELFLKEKFYDEAWAVYDWDEKTNQHQKKHAEVFPLLQRNQGKLFVAFSSYSFEEWILSHFERNEKKFTESDCSDVSKHSYMCGSIKADNENDCHGDKCIAGYIRSRGYIPFYSKGDKSLFSNYTLRGGKVNRYAIFNAAWLRYKGQRFSSDAYTDVDILVRKMLGDDYSCEWHSLDDPFPFGGTVLKIVERDSYLYVKNVGNQSCGLTPSNFVTTNINGQKGHALLDCNYLLRPGECHDIDRRKVEALLKFVSVNSDYIIDIQTDALCI